jgi:hypothetical protein
MFRTRYCIGPLIEALRFAQDKLRPDEGSPSPPLRGPLPATAGRGDSTGFARSGMTQGGCVILWYVVTKMTTYADAMHPPVP